MNITKAMAEDAAELMAQAAFNDKIEALHNIIKEAYEIVFKARVPAEVIAAVNKYPLWLSGTKSVYYYWNGLSYYEDISFFVPLSKKSIGSLLADEEGKKDIQAKLQKLEIAKEEKRAFYGKCFYNLLSLKTRKRIEEIFPEAMEYIQWPSGPIKNLPAVQLEELRFTLQKCRKG